MCYSHKSSQITYCLESDCTLKKFQLQREDMHPCPLGYATVWELFVWLKRLDKPICWWELWQSVRRFLSSVSVVCRRHWQRCLWRLKKKKITRWAGQSPTWGRPAPQVRVESQFMYSKFLSQQWQLVNDSEKNHLAYGLASAYSMRAFRVDQYARCNFFVCGPKFITWPEKVWWENSN